MSLDAEAPRTAAEMPAISDKTATNFTAAWLLKSTSSDSEPNDCAPDVKTGSKRVTDTVNRDQRGFNPKKRRKQTNPTRISSDGENANVTNGNNNERAAAPLLSPDANVNATPKQNGGGPAKGKMKLTGRQHAAPSNVLPLNLTKSGGAQKRLPDDSKKTIKNNYPLNVGGRPPLKQESAAELPTKYYAAFSQRAFAKTKRDNFPVAVGRPYAMPPVKNNNRQPSGHAANVRMSPVPVQIFNPEAFCDLCNKEFCNKYFLKTHKANKHGIYGDDGPFADQHDKSQNKIPLPPIAGDLPPNDRSGGTSPSTSAAFRGAHAQPAAAAAGNTGSSKSSANPQNRAFCNLCQKEFCNKYFVKRHKAKIHGFTVDNGDYCKNDHGVPLKFKTNGETRKNNVSTDMNKCYDKNDKFAPGPSETPKNVRPKTAAKGAVQKPVANEAAPVQTKAFRVESPCNQNIKVERSDEHYVNKVPNGLYGTTHGHGDNGEIANNSTRNINAYYGQSAHYYGDNPKNDYGTAAMGRKTDDAHEHTKTANVAKNNDGIIVDENIVTAAAAADRTDKSKLLAFHNFIFQLNERSLENVLKCYLCNAPVVDGSLKSHIFDKHEHLVSELMNETLELCNNSAATNTRAEYSCHDCRLTFDTDASLKTHFDQWDCGDKGCRASTASPADDDEQLGLPLPYFGSPGETQHYAIFSSFCKICNKELCNKYFMKTHMRRMHGISIKIGNNIGGVMCDICNKELCSKYFLRVHKQNSHGVVDAGGPGTKNGWQVMGPTAAAANVGGCGGSGGSQAAAEETDVGNNRYYRHYTEVCGVCFRRFRSSKWLSAHLLNEHGDEGKTQWTQIQNHHATVAEQNDKQQTIVATAAATVPRAAIYETNEPSSATPSVYGTVPQLERNSASPEQRRPPTIEEMKHYRCSYCAFTTSILSFLFVHEKFHLAEHRNAVEDALVTTPMQTCSVCCAQFPDTAQLENHLIHWHFNNNNNNNSNNNYTGAFPPPGPSWAPVSRRSPVAPSVNFAHTIADIGCPRSAAYNNSVVQTSDVTYGNDAFVAELGPPTIEQTPPPWYRAGTNVAVPNYGYVPNHEPFIMQSFFLENGLATPPIEAELRAAGRSDPFHSSLVYLPVKEKLTSTVNVFFKLTPT
ncbi:Zinc finger C2H2-type [Cinara cedri]|uniref:Zinc finger C2H2-type n=1 Tax=Cinara cedri TaxID=506608 RepID=A0A5E4MHJ8_9HEMI|nr:Zinc finger C2H2-type [Cinara cedri]